jgi:hypothetical protein
MWIDPKADLSARDRFDVSKLDQWEIAFSHMDKLGIQLHVVTQEKENDEMLDGGSLGTVRKLYYRELVARFAHHHAIVWNLGEENQNTDNQRQAYYEYIQELDPYDHPMTIHTLHDRVSDFYAGMLDRQILEMTSIQGEGSMWNAWAIEMRQLSAAAGRPWVVCCDEQGQTNDWGLTPSLSNLNNVRKDALWGNLMGGGGGVEWILAGTDGLGDIGTEDFRDYEPVWEQTNHAVEFFQQYVPFWEMEPDNSLITGLGNFALAKPGQIYVAYLRNGGNRSLTIESGTYDVYWFDPINGGALKQTSTRTITGPGQVPLGYPPSGMTESAVLVRRR